MWYGGPQWQIDALWRFQIPDVLQRHLGLPAASPRPTSATSWGLNSARLYGLTGRKAIAVGNKGSAYRQGPLADYPRHLQPGSRLDKVLTGVGYPTPVTPVSLIPNDNLTKLKNVRTDADLGRSNQRFGWTRTQL